MGKGKKFCVVRGFSETHVFVLMESKTEVKAGRQEVMECFKISDNEQKSRSGTFMT